MKKIFDTPVFINDICIYWYVSWDTLLSVLDDKFYNPNYNTSVNINRYDYENEDYFNNIDNTILYIIYTTELTPYICDFDTFLNDDLFLENITHLEGIQNTDNLNGQIEVLEYILNIYSNDNNLKKIKKWFFWDTYEIINYFKEKYNLKNEINNNIINEKINLLVKQDGISWVDISFQEEYLYEMIKSNKSTIFDKEVGYQLNYPWMNEKDYSKIDKFKKEIKLLDYNNLRIETDINWYILNSEKTVNDNGDWLKFTLLEMEWMWYTNVWTLIELKSNINININTNTKYIAVIWVNRFYWNAINQYWEEDIINSDILDIIPLSNDKDFLPIIKYLINIYWSEIDLLNMYWNPDFQDNKEYLLKYKEDNKYMNFFNWIIHKNECSSSIDRDACWVYTTIEQMYTPEEKSLLKNPETIINHIEEILKELKNNWTYISNWIVENCHINSQITILKL